MYPYFHWILLSLLFGVTSLFGADDVGEELSQLVERQKSLIAWAGRVGTQDELEDLRRPLQSLINDYEALLKTHPDEPAVYVSYALLLKSDVVSEHRRAAGLLLKANEINPDLPLVKNELGNFVAEEGKPLDALNYYLAAASLDPNESLYHYQIGNLLTEARETFVHSGHWTSQSVDDGVIKAFAKAAELAPDRIDLGYRHAMAFYDLENPRWEEALSAWQDLHVKVSTPIEHQTLSLHEARVLAKLERMTEAQLKVAGVTETILQAQKEKLIAEWSDKPDK